MNDNFWYPRDPQRYLTDTQWCDAATEVAHVRLIDTYYALGRPIKDEQERIQNIGKIKPADFARVRGNLFELGWRIESGFWRHKRIEETLAEMDSERLAQIKRTKAASEALAKKRNEERNKHRNDDRNDVPTTTTTTTTTKATTDNHNEGEARPPATFAETPSWEEFWAHCQSPTVGIGAEWYAKDKYWLACQDNWKGKSDWRAYARRVRVWWENDGRPMVPPNKKWQSAPVVQHLQDATWDARTPEEIAEQEARRRA